MNETNCTNCDKSPTVAKGLCAACYQYQRRGGTVDDRKPRTPPGEGEQIALRLSSDRLKAWERAAKKAKQAFRDWLRDAGDEKAGLK